MRNGHLYGRRAHNNHATLARLAASMVVISNFDLTFDLNVTIIGKQ